MTLVNVEKLVYRAYHVIHIHTGDLFWVTAKKKADSNAEKMSFSSSFLLLEYLSGDKEPVEKFRLTNYFVLHIFISHVLLLYSCGYNLKTFWSSKPLQ